MSKRMVDLKVEDGKIASIDGYELGGSGGSKKLGVNVTITGGEDEVDGDSRPGWISPNDLKPNTAYAVGDQVMADLTRSFETKAKTLESNQIFVPTNVYNNFDLSNKKLQSGDVRLILTDVTSDVDVARSGQKYWVNVRFYLTYSVVQAGTTGNSFNFSWNGWKVKSDWEIYTLELTNSPT